MIQMKEIFNVIFGIILIIAVIVFLVSMISLIFNLYANADEVKCNSFGNCIFTTTIKNITITKECYENDELIDCSNDNYDKYRED